MGGYLPKLGPCIEELHERMHCQETGRSGTASDQRNPHQVLRLCNEFRWLCEYASRDDIYMADGVVVSSSRS